MTLTRQSLEALDRADALRGFRERFELPENVIYLDGNSLGAMAGSVRERVADVVEREWGHGLIRSWNDADWIGPSDVNVSCKRGSCWRVTSCMPGDKRS